MGFSLVLVDDSNVARRYVKKEMLSLLNYNDITIIEGSNGKEACEACHANDVDLMVIDLTMPVMTGYEALECLKKSGKTIKAIVLSADIQPGVEEKVKASGAIAYLKKPFNKEQMSKILKENGFNVKF